jgi:hypothetical protein
VIGHDLKILCDAVHKIPLFAFVQVLYVETHQIKLMIAIQHINTAGYSKLFTTRERRYSCYVQPKHFHSFEPIYPTNNTAGVQNSQEPGHHGNLLSTVSDA